MLFGESGIRAAFNEEVPISTQRIASFIKISNFFVGAIFAAAKTGSCGVLFQKTGSAASFSERLCRPSSPLSEFFSFEACFYFTTICGDLPFLQKKLPEKDIACQTVFNNFFIYAWVSSVSSDFLISLSIIVLLSRRSLKLWL